jgi:hypothetical protein
MVSDRQEDPNPTEQDLQDWHTRYPERFTQPATLTFSHVYFSHLKFLSMGAYSTDF